MNGTVMRLRHVVAALWLTGAAPLIPGTARAQATVAPSVPDPAGVQRLPARPARPARPNGSVRTAPVVVLDASARGWLAATIASPRALDIPDEADSVAARVARCLSLFDRRGAPVRTPWAAFDSATADRLYVLVQVAASAEPPAACPASTDASVTTAGVVLLGTGARPGASDDLRRATLLSAGREIAPTVAGRVEAAVLRPSFDDSTPAQMHQLRFYLSPDAVDPDAQGRFAPLEVRVATGTRGARGAERSVEIPDTLVARTWRELLGWRLERLRGAKPGAPLPSFAPPSDTVLARARLAYATGDPLRAAELTAARIQLAHLASDNLRFAALLVGSTLLAYGDTIAARAEYRSALRAAPCTRLREAPAYDRVLLEVRDPRVRCGPWPFAALLARGLLVPGGAQRVRGDRVGARVSAVVTAGLLATAGDLWYRAHVRHVAYTRASAPPLVEPQLDRANALLAAAGRYAIAGAATWVASALVGAVAERLHPPSPKHPAFTAAAREERR